MLEAALAAATIDANGAVGWISRNIVPILLAFIGAGIIAGAHKGNSRKTMTTSGLALIGVAFVLGAFLLSQVNILDPVIRQGPAPVIKQEPAPATSEEPKKK